ncbi:MAG TPA: glutaredoxin domain-containing protein [Ktedonobacterales bacterium]
MAGQVPRENNRNSSTGNADMTDTAGSAAAIVMYSTTWCPDCRRAKRVFESARVSYREVNIERHPEGAALVRRLNAGMQSVPTIVFPDGSVLVEPSTRELEAKLRHITG